MDRHTNKYTGQLVKKDNENDTRWQTEMRVSGHSEARKKSSGSFRKLGK